MKMKSYENCLIGAALTSGALIGALITVGYLRNAEGDQTASAQPDRSSIESILAYSYLDQPVLVPACPDGGTALPRGSGVQADLLGRGGIGRDYKVIGDGSHLPVFSYDIDHDGDTDAWCGEISDTQNPDTLLYHPDASRTAPAFLVIPAWEGCNRPTEGEAFDCLSSPLEFGPIAGTPDGTLIITIPDQTAPTY
jgi:hypothetical protein